MDYHPHSDEWNLIDSARKRLDEFENGDGDALAVLAEVIDRYEKLVTDTSRLVRISDQIGENLKQPANVDSATGIFNRAYFYEIAERELQRSHRFDHPLSILLIAIDHFSRINDAHGEHAADTALKTLAAASVGILRQVDAFGRVGGEEFAALLPETDTTGAVILAERLRETIARMGISVGPEVVEVTVSIGVASRTSAPISIAELLAKADEAMAAAKSEGRNRVVIASWPEQD